MNFSMLRTQCPKIPEEPPAPPPAPAPEKKEEAPPPPPTPPPPPPPPRDWYMNGLDVYSQMPGLNSIDAVECRFLRFNLRGYPEDYYGDMYNNYGHGGGGYRNHMHGGYHHHHHHQPAAHWHAPQLSPPPAYNYLPPAQYYGPPPMANYHYHAHAPAHRPAGYLPYYY